MIRANNQRMFSPKSGWARGVVFGFAASVVAGSALCSGAKVGISVFGPEIPLFEEQGRMYIGNQLEWFDVTQNGQVSTAEPGAIEIYHTERREFFIRGEVFLGGTYSEMRFASDLESGFTVFARETGGQYRYELNPTRIRNKRRIREGEAVEGIEVVEWFPEPPLEEWLMFSALVASDRIVFQIGDQIGRIRGPVSMDGRASIGIAPGSKVRNVRLSFVEGSAEGDAISGAAKRNGFTSPESDIKIRVRPGG